MDLCKRVAEIENKDFSKLSEEELIIWNYYNTYKEANLYYELMVSCINTNMKDLAMVYAEKGKLASTRAITLNSKLTLLQATDKAADLGNILKRDCEVLQNNVDGVTKTIHHLAVTGDFGNIIEKIPAPAKKTNHLESVRLKLAEDGFTVPENADPKKQANASLKILDRLLLTGQISQKVYNQKCREIMLKKPKSA